MSRIGSTTLAALAAAAVLVGGAVAEAGNSVSKTVDFSLGTWIDLNLTEGPVTLHRIRLVEQTGQFTKSQLFRPVGGEYLKTVQIQLEYSNAATKDWEAYLVFEWLDADGEVIDGYRDSESLDDGEVHDTTTVTLSTLKYGLDKAKTIRFTITVSP